jgi:hypothetical protein
MISLYNFDGVHATPTTVTPLSIADCLNCYGNPKCFISVLSDIVIQRVSPTRYVILVHDRRPLTDGKSIAIEYVIEADTPTTLVPVIESLLADPLTGLH